MKRGKYSFTSKQIERMEWVAALQWIRQAIGTKEMKKWREILERLCRREHTIEDLIQIYMARPPMGRYGRYFGVWCGKNGIFKRIRRYAENEGYKFNSGGGTWGRFTKVQSSCQTTKVMDA